MKKFEAPQISVTKLNFENVFTESNDCRVEALGCTSCYCVAVTCDHTPECPGCFDDWDNL